MNWNKLLRYIIYTGLFALLLVPFVVSDSMFFPFITGKNFAFRILVEIIFGAWVILAIREAQWRPKKSWLCYGFGALLLVMLASALFGANTYKSIWSNFERMEGWVTLLHLYGLFAVASSMLDTEALWTRFFRTSIGVSVVLGLYGVAQVLGWATIHQGGVRVDATLGNATYLAAYMLFHIFITGWLLIRHRGREHVTGWDKWTLFYTAALLLQLFTLYQTATRGAILGLIGGAMLAALLIALFARDNARLRKRAGAGLLAVVILVGGFVALRNQPFIQDSQVLSRFANISLEDKTTRSRFMVWNMGLKGFVERPVLGWGQESFNYIFNKHYNPQMYDQEQWFDRAHNVLLDWLTAGGILGLLAYLSLFAFAIWYIWKRRDRMHLSVTEKAILTGMLAAYFFHNLFVFDNITSYLLFVSVLAFIHWRTAEPINWPESHRRPEYSPVHMVGIPAAFVGTLIALYVFNYNGIVQARTLIDAMQIQRQNPEAALEVYRRAIDVGSYGTQEVRERLTQSAVQIGGNEDIPLGVRQQYFTMARDQMRAHIERDPNNARLHVFLGSLFNRYGFYEESVETLGRALELSPQKQSTMFELVTAHVNAERYDEALQVAREAFDAAPQFKKARLVYASAAIYAGENETAKTVLEEEYGTDLVPEERIIRAYAVTDQFDKIIEIRRAQIAEDPNNVALYIRLAAAYLEEGRAAEAIAALEDAMEVDPNFRQQGQQYIDDIRAGRLP